jgi:CHAT domain-containing protein/tetratricopeptide (TPR) repeat protein
VLLLVIVLFVQGSAGARPNGGGAGTPGSRFHRYVIVARQEPVGRSGGASSNSGKGRLETGKSVERELAGGQGHVYELEVASGKCFEATVEQRGIDVVVRVFDPANKQVLEINQKGPQGSESIFVPTDVSGNYRLEIAPADKQAPIGRYLLRLDKIREATARDRGRLAAEQSFVNAQTMLREGSAASLRKAVQAFGGAAVQFKAIGEPRMEAEARHFTGFIQNQLGEFKQALASYGEALELKKHLKDDDNRALTINNIGIVHDRMGNYEKAIEQYTEARELYRSSGNRRREAETLNNTGIAQKNLGAYQKALDNYNAALTIAREVADQRTQARALNNIGAVYNILVKSQEALDSFNQASRLFQAIGDRLGAASAAGNMGTVWDRLGETDRAVEKYREALTLFKALGDRRWEAQALLNIGVAYQQAGQYQKSLESSREALELFRAMGNSFATAHLLMTMANIYGDLGENEKALKNYDEALTAIRGAKDPRLEAIALTNLGIFHNRSGDKKKAVEYLLQALSQLKAIEVKDGQADAHRTLAEIYAGAGELTRARTEIESSVAVIESVRSGATAGQLRMSFFASAHRAFETYIDILMRLHRGDPGKGFDALAFDVNERARSRVLLDLLAEAKVDLRRGVSPELLEKHRNMRRLHSEATERYAQLLARKGSDEQLAAAKKETFGLEEKQEEVEAAIRKASPHYAELTGARPLSIGEIQKEVIGPDTVLLEYALGDQKSYLWVVTDSSVATWELPKRAEIDSLVSRRVQMTDPAADYGEVDQELSRMLLAPARSLLNKPRLVIVPDGALHYVPFGALPDPSTGARGKTSNQSGADRPLIVDHEVVNLPSASVLALIRRELGGRKVAPKSVAIFADPVFTEEDSRVKRETDRGTSANQRSATKIPSSLERVMRGARQTGDEPLSRLLSTLDEARVISSLAGSRECKVALGFEANWETATSPDLRQYRILHFATHGFINEVHPELSGIVLSTVNEDGKPRQRGLLLAGDLYNIDLPVEMVVLSGCQTALGKEIRGEGLIGITRGFMYAGVPRVVSSLWKVDSEATAELMKRFYLEMLRNHRRPAAALRLAQISMWRQKRWRSSFYWAGFIHQGEWR